MKTISLCTVLCLIIAIQTSKAQDLSDFFSKSDHFFHTYIKDGKVDYKAIKTDPKALNEVLEIAASVSITKDDSNAYQAFWINGYNLHVIKGVVDQYPVKSPLDIPGFFDTTKRNIGGMQITLNAIENELLRASFPSEARFHFVLVCAGLGCPPIINGAYLPGDLETQLQTQTELALNNPNFIQVKGKRVLLSQLFEWYKVDFTQKGKSEIDFVNTYRKEKISPNAKIGYYPYDWTLNETK